MRLMVRALCLAVLFIVAVNNYQWEAFNTLSEIISGKQERVKVSKGLKVPYTEENIERCICPECPVLASSECAGNKFKNFREEIINMEKGDISEPENVRRVHCSNGITTCKDIDPSQPCICSSCAVWQEYELANGNSAGYFCKKGRVR